MYQLKTRLLAAAAAAVLLSSGSAFAQSVNTATTTAVTPPVQTLGAGATTDVTIGAIDDANLPVGFPGQVGVSGHSFSTLIQAIESDGSGANAVVNGEGDLTLSAFDDGQVNTSQVNLTGTTISAITGSATITTTGGTTINGGVSVNGGINNNGGGISNIGAISGVTSLSISGVASLAGGVSTSTLTTSGLATLNSLAVTNNASVGGALTVTGLSTLSGGATITGGAGKSLVVNGSGTTANGGAVLWSGVGAGNSIVTDTTSSRLVSGSNNLAVGAGGVGASGNGATLTLNGTTTALTNSNSRGLSTSATTTTVTGGASGGNASTLTLNATTASLTTQDGNGLSATQGGAVSVTGAQGSGTQRAGMAMSSTGGTVSLLNNTGHGISTTSTSTTVSGGTTSTTMTLDDSGATFADSGGGPAKVTGVARGTTQYDAVNFGQMQGVEEKLSAGIAMASALAGMPQVEPGKRFSVAVGGGYYRGEGAASLGFSARSGDSTVFKLGVAGTTEHGESVNGGVGFSW